MKKQISRTIAILSLLAVMSGVSLSVAAAPCSRPSCRGNGRAIATEVTVTTEKKENPDGMTVFLARLAELFFYMR